MSKAVDIQKQNNDDGPDLLFMCPGCKCAHGIRVNNQNQGANWSFNGNYDKPTFRPSVLVKGYSKELEKEITCHSFVTDGSIQFLNDCNHELAGKTVELEDFK